MTTLSRFIGDFIRHEDGPTAVEYGVMMALIIVVCVATVALIGSNSVTTYNKVGTAMKSSGS